MTMPGPGNSVLIVTASPGSEHRNISCCVAVIGLTGRRAGLQLREDIIIPPIILCSPHLWQQPLQEERVGGLQGPGSQDATPGQRGHGGCGRGSLLPTRALAGLAHKLGTSGVCPAPPHTVISGPEAPVLAGPGMTRERCSRRAGASRWPAGARAGQLWSEAAAPGPGRPRAPTAAARLPEGRGHGGGPQEAWQGAVGGWSARHSLARAWLRGVSRVSGYLPVTQPGSARMGRGQPKQAPRSRA